MMRFAWPYTSRLQLRIDNSGYYRHTASVMMRAKPLIIWCLAGRAIALSVSRRTFAIGTAAAPFAAYADVPAQTYDGLYVVEGSKSRRRVVTRDGAVVVEAEEDGRWRALESSADSDGLLVGGRVEIKFRRDASSTASNRSHLVCPPLS